MSKEKPTTKICKHCKTEMPFGAKICPQCRKKQGMGMLPKIIIAFIAVGVIGAIAGGGSDETAKTSNSPVSNPTSTDKAETEATTETTTEATTEAPIEYMEVSVDEMIDMLDSNAMKASETYKKQYLEITGKLSVIDSSGKYISLAPVEDDFSIIGVQCYIKTDDQKSKVMEMSVGDTVTLRGKITDVGEIIGYSLDIDEFN